MAIAEYLFLKRNQRRNSNALKITIANRLVDLFLFFFYILVYFFISLYNIETACFSANILS